MTVENMNTQTRFEHMNTQYNNEQKVRDMSATCLSLADLCIQYAGIERVPRYNETHRENDAEHSLMVAILSVELADEFRPDLDKGLLSQYSTVHDCVEIAVGDTPTYHLNEQELVAKHIREQSALESLLEILPPYTAQLLRQYEQQLSPEARFVRAVDKLTPLLVDIIGPGQLVLRKDYGINSISEVVKNKLRLDESMTRRFGEDTPEIVAIYKQLGDMFVAECSTLRDL